MVKLVKKKPVVTPEEKPGHLGPTERRWMPHKQKDQMFKTLTVMAEDHNPAFDILMTVFELEGDNGFHEIATTLDDMNIRGEQIVIARASYVTLGELLAAIRERSPWLIDQINTRWRKAFMEKAVPSGAHKWMHKKIADVPRG